MINKRIIDRTVLSRIPKEERSILWSFSPLTYGLEDSFGHTVYHSVDLLHTIPGVPELLLLARERHVLALSSTVVASSTGVAKHLKELGRNDVILWENVASTELFSASGHERTPRAIFAGNLTETKIAVPLFEALINRGVPIAIAGPVGIDGTRLSVPAEAVLAHPLVSYLGNLSLQDLAIEVGRSQVGLIPYLRNEYTRGVFPMKVFEYLASGLSVVSTELESLIDAQIEGLEVVGDEDFADVVHAEIAAFSESAATGRTLAASAHSWTSRIHDASELVERLAANEDCVTSAGRTALPGESRG